MKNGKLVGSVKEVWRYPVKSMQGEQVTQCDVTKQGVVGDRGWAIKDNDADEIRGVRKIPKLLHCQAAYVHEPVRGGVPVVNIATPNGEMLKAGGAECEEQLSTYLKRPVSVWPLQPTWNLKHYRLKALATSKDLRNQFGTDTTPDISSISLKLMLELAVFATPLGRYYDCYPLHILTTSSLNTMAEYEAKGDFNARRFRPNFLIETEEDQQGLAEFDWVGGILVIGETLIKIETRTVRCSMPAQPQCGLEKSAPVVKAMVNHTDRHLGVYATVIKDGIVKQGDSVVFYQSEMMRLAQKMEPVRRFLKKQMMDASLALSDFVADRLK